MNSNELFRIGVGLDSRASLTKTQLMVEKITPEKSYTKLSIELISYPNI